MVSFGLNPNSSADRRRPMQQKRIQGAVRGSPCRATSGQLGLFQFARPDRRFPRNDMSCLVTWLLHSPCTINVFNQSTTGIVQANTKRDELAKHTVEQSGNYVTR